MKRLSALFLIISTTSACSWMGFGEDSSVRNRSDDYLKAQQSAQMRLPEGIRSKRLDDLLPIPVNVASMTVSEYEVPRPPLLLPTEGIYSDFTLQKKDNVRWLVAKRTPAQVWPMTLRFFEGSGFQIATENQRTGEFITAWQPRKDLSAALGSGTNDNEDGNSDSDIRIRVRVEPGVQSDTTEVFVATALRDSDSGDEDREWLTDTGVETSLLDGLMMSLANNDQEASQTSLLSEREYDAPSLARLSDDSSGNPVLILGTDYDRGWSSIGHALETADIRVDDLDRTTGTYYVDLAKGSKQTRKEPGFFDWLLGAPDAEVEQEDGGPSERYMVRLVGVGNNVQVAVLNNGGAMAPYEVSRQLLSRLQTQILTPTAERP